MEPLLPLPTLTDDLLHEIFLRIGSPADLVRASAACVAFRRLIADPTFLRRYRSLHPPQLLGFIDSGGRGFQPAEAPHPSAALARAVARAADFPPFGDYLPLVTGSRWQVRDVRNGRVLVKCLPEEEDGEEEFFLPDLAVCDPLARRCLLLPRIHEDLFASVDVQHAYIDAYLVPSGDGEDDNSFRVIAKMICTEMVVGFIFSSATGHWSAGTPVSWDALTLSIPPTKRVLFWSPYYAYGCCYWKFSCRNKWLKFNMSSLDFSADEIIEEPAHVGSLLNHAIFAEAGEGKVWMFRLSRDRASLCYTIRQIVGERDQPKMDNIIPLPVGYGYHTMRGPYEGHIFIKGSQLSNLEGTYCFTLEIKTFKIERVCQVMPGNINPYFGFPPFMSPIRV